MVGKSACHSAASKSQNRSNVSLSTSSGRASWRSILLITTMTGRPSSSVLDRTKRVCGSGPSAASTRSRTPSAIFSVRSTSPPKSEWPGVSMMLMVTSPNWMLQCLARMVMPRSRSRSFESITRSTVAALSRNTPVCLSMASTSVVLPWSTWAMMAMLRREAAMGGRPGSPRKGLEQAKNLEIPRISAQPIQNARRASHAIGRPAHDRGTLRWQWNLDGPGNEQEIAPLGDEQKLPALGVEREPTAGLEYDALGRSFSSPRAHRQLDAPQTGQAVRRQVAQGQHLDRRPIELHQLVQADAERTGDPQDDAQRRIGLAGLQVGDRRARHTRLLGQSLLAEVPALAQLLEVLRQACR